ncbi:phage antirepressor N-terminal domain-containing protein [Lacinutrix sp. Hel_I_90]|uniref:phage antirepressor N-terminal domain-containing protein n=1 Tax=Lacinutrix sp. Hel_I_90 TaxID=1249999 RepID=UPI000698829C|nr:phage antirepressor N-terminal domain-containing protein [Lacinutrix sp. Hel_I_90]
MTDQTITVNEKEIIISTNGIEKYVAIKPICEAIGVDYSSQLKKIKEDPILGSTVVLTTTVGADENKRKMQTLPLRYIFGWLFRIDSRNVKEDIRDNVEKYQKECYDVLFDTFTKRNSILKEKTNYQIQIEQLESNWKLTDDYKKIEELKKLQKNASKRLNSLDKNVVEEQLDLFKKEESI